MTNNNLQPIRRAQAVRGSRRGEKGLAMPLVIAIVALVVVIGGVSYFAAPRREPQSDGTMVKPGGTMIKPDGALAPSGVEGMMAKYTGTVLAGKSAPLLDYNKADYDAAIASDKLVVLYFYANWCPICKEEVANALIPAFNELKTDKVVGIRVNYKDSDTDKDEENLARQLGIPYQHTKVFMKNGKQIVKAPDGWDKARYIAEINKALAQ